MIGESCSRESSGDVEKNGVCGNTLGITRQKKLGGEIKSRSGGASCGRGLKVQDRMQV